MNGSHVTITGRLKHLAELTNYVLVNQVSVQILRSNRHDASLTNEWAEALEGGKVDDLEIGLAEELD